jgi:hypothetical protein
MVKSYLVIKKVSLLVGKKTYRKDAIITADDVGQSKIERYLKSGYIKPIGEVPEVSDKKDERPFYLTTDEFLTPEQVDDLERPQLIEYANHIGVPEFRTNIPTKALKKLVNEFIEEASKVEDDPPEDDPKDDVDPSGDDGEDGDADGSDADETGDEEEPDAEPPAASLPPLPPRTEAQ